MMLNITTFSPTSSSSNDSIVMIGVSNAFTIVVQQQHLNLNTHNTHNRNRRSTSSSIKLPKEHNSKLHLSDWSDFAALDDDYDDDDDLLFDTTTLRTTQDDLGPPGKRQGYADENDSQEYKAEIGNTINAPSISWDGEPLVLPQGSVLPLTEENVQGVLAACRMEIGTMFGYSAENRGVGITGGVDFVDFDGPSVIVKLKGRFWHQRTTVLERVEKYIQGRIPEVIEVIVEDPWELSDEANDAAY